MGSSMMACLLAREDFDEVWEWDFFEESRGRFCPGGGGVGVVVVDFLVVGGQVRSFWWRCRGRCCSSRLSGIDPFFFLEVSRRCIKD